MIVGERLRQSGVPPPSERWNDGHETRVDAALELEPAKEVAERDGSYACRGRAARTSITSDERADMSRLQPFPLDRILTEQAREKFTGVTAAIMPCCRARPAQSRR